MRKHRAAGGGTWKTFFIYGGLVLFLIVASLTAKGYAVWQKNKFDGNQHFVLAVEKEGRVYGIVAFQPANKSLAILHITDNKPSLSSLGESLGILPDGVLQAEMQNDVDGMLLAALWKYGSLKTDLTIFDIIRLIPLAQKPSDNFVKKVQLPQEESDIDKIIASFFADRTLYSEGADIHIVNASGVPGMARKLERVVNNLGGNVVRTSTAHRTESVSTIRYSGKMTYAVKRLQRLFGFPLDVKNDTVGIVITIGEDLIL